MKILDLRNTAEFKHVLIFINGIKLFTIRDFPLTEFDLAQVFDIRIIPSRADKIVTSGTLHCNIPDDITKTVYSITIKYSCGAKGVSVKHFLVDKNEQV